MLVWLGWLATQARGGVLDLPTAWPANLWHGHEMIIGYAGATLGGFLLTSASGGRGLRACRIALSRWCSGCGCWGGWPCGTRPFCRPRLWHWPTCPICRCWEAGSR
ncbi:NnrS family protein [Fuscovulum blasticum]|uniref:NnrS family protein n=1 Tax=Fuscovulum blasticum TaxID=1075 RepID=UPI003AAFE8EA